MSKVHLTKINYKDGFDFMVKNNKLSIKEIYIIVFSSTPKWADFLIQIRNKIAKLLSLKTEKSENDKTNFKVGDKAGFF